MPIKDKDNSKEIKSFLKIILGVVLYIAAMPPLGWWWAMPVAVALLASANVRKFYIWALVGVAVALGLTSWMTHVSVAGWLAVGLAMGAFWAVPLWLWKKYPYRSWVAAVWVGIEGLRAFLGFGWLPVAASAVGQPYLRQWVTLGGEGLLSFIIIFVGLSAARVVIEKIEKNIATKIIKIRELMLMVIFIFFGGLALQVLVPTKSNGEMKIGLVQPDVPMSTEGQARDYYNELNALRYWSNKIKNNDAQVIFWPEQATPWPVNSDPNMRRWMGEAAQYLGVPIVSGVLWSEGEKYYNAATVVDTKNGVSDNAYKKRRLVPFGEYIPLAQWGWMRSLTPIVGSFDAGEAPEILTAGGLKIFPLICYEDAFESLAWGAGRDANMIAVFLNDSWFGPGMREQHAAHSVLRALEQGLPVVRVANSGLSGIISPMGQAEYLNNGGDVKKATSQVVTLSLEKRSTPYAATAPWWRWGFVGVAFVGVIIFVWRKVKKPQQ